MVVALGIQPSPVRVDCVSQPNAQVANHAPCAAPVVTLNAGNDFGFLLRHPLVYRRSHATIEHHFATKRNNFNYLGEIT